MLLILTVASMAGCGASPGTELSDAVTGAVSNIVPEDRSAAILDTGIRLAITPPVKSRVVTWQLSFRASGNSEPVQLQFPIVLACRPEITIHVPSRPGIAVGYPPHQVSVEPVELVDCLKIDPLSEVIPDAVVPLRTEFLHLLVLG